MADPIPLHATPDRLTMTRRLLLQGGGALLATPWLARALAGVAAAATPLPLPLRLTQIVNHIGISVPDVVRSATFYSHLFDGTRIVGQDKPALRYSIDFFPGAMAIGKLQPSADGGAHAHALIDHFCVATVAFNQAAWRAQLDREKLRYFARGTFVEVDNIPVQLIGGHEGDAKGPAGGGFKAMPPLYTGEPLVRPHGFHHVMLHVSDLEASAALFRKLFGLTPHESSSGGVFFGVGAIRLELRQTAAGEKPGIASYAIRVAKLDRSRVGGELEALGAKVEPADGAGKGTVLRFADPDGIRCELWAA
jgi:catechol 2,3-dioxygenase-like lactoylglutathione lyase family enzyme